MELSCSQVLLSVSNLQRSREFYVAMLGFPVIEDHPRMFAFRAGDVRVSVFAGGRESTAEEADASNMNLMFRCSDLDQTVTVLRAKGLEFDGEIEEAPGFMRHVRLQDPDHNLLYLAEYSRDPLAPVN